MTIPCLRYLLFRQHAAYGDDGLKYKYSGVTVDARPWTPALKELKDIVEKHSGFRYNFVLVNRCPLKTCQHIEFVLIFKIPRWARQDGRPQR